MYIMKKIPPYMWQQFISHSFEAVKYPFNARYGMRQSLCLRCVDTSVPMLDT